MTDEQEEQEEQDEQEDNEEPEGFPELEELERVKKSVETQISRFKSLKQKGKLKDMLEDELISTILPLMLRQAEASIAHAEVFEEWASGIEDDVESGGGGSSEPELSREEIGILRWLLSRLGELVVGSKRNPDAPPELKQAMLEIEVRLGKGMKILDGLEDEDDDEQEESESEETTAGE